MSDLKKSIHCTSCKNHFKVLDKQKGKYANCVHCGKKIFVFSDESESNRKDELKRNDNYPIKKSVNL